MTAPKLALLLLLISACTGQLADGDALIPDPPLDAPPITCEASACGDAGCCGDRCCALEPSNAGDIGALEPTGLTITPPAGTFDTAEHCVTPSSLGACTPIDVADGVDLCVCRMDELTLGDLTITGARALVILAYEHVVVAGDVVVAPGAGTGNAYATGVANQTGGAGGSYSTLGGNGAAPAYGTAELVPLVGGMSGQSSCNGKQGGAGGGALQITAGTDIVVLGSISAGGGGGQGGSSAGTCLGGAGGGSGGAILLEAPTVQVPGRVAANGGGGGGGGSNDYGGGYSGSAGSLAGGAAGGSGQSGHGCPLQGYTSGGSGGAGSSLINAGSTGAGGDYISGCLGGTTYLGAGGGGGGGGRIRVNTETGCQCGGGFAPAPTFGTLIRR